jgi:hypothetical protein
MRRGRQRSLDKCRNLLGSSFRVVRGAGARRCPASRSSRALDILVNLAGGQIRNDRSKAKSAGFDAKTDVWDSLRRYQWTAVVVLSYLAC